MVLAVERVTVAAETLSEPLQNAGCPRVHPVTHTVHNVDGGSCRCGGTEGGYRGAQGWHGLPFQGSRQSEPNRLAQGVGSDTPGALSRLVPVPGGLWVGQAGPFRSASTPPPSRNKNLPLPGFRREKGFSSGPQKSVRASLCGTAGFPVAQRKGIHPPRQETWVQPLGHKPNNKVDKEILK